MSRAASLDTAPREGCRQLDGRVAIVTGGSTGIGEAIVRRFAAEGARVAFCSRSEAAGRAMERELKAAGHEVAFSVADISLEAEAADLIRQTAERYGGLDIVVNNAAVSRQANVEEMSLTDWEFVVTKNLSSMFLMAREAIPLLRRSKNGSIINLGSTYSFVGAAGSSAYALTKAAAVSFTKTLAIELGPDNIRVNALCPGATVTQLYHQWIASQADQAQAKAELLAKFPIGRLGTPEDMAGAALFLASDSASFVTGHALLVDGGYTAI